VKATLEIPDDLFERARAAAERREISLDSFVVEALQEFLEGQTASGSLQRGWRSVLGQATRAEVESVDALVAEELERIDSDEWR
jgi:hypothetical protein